MAQNSFRRGVRLVVGLICANITYLRLLAFVSCTPQAVRSSTGPRMHVQYGKTPRASVHRDTDIVSRFNAGIMSQVEEMRKQAGFDFPSLQSDVFERFSSPIQNSKQSDEPVHMPEELHVTATTVMLEFQPREKLGIRVDSNTGEVGEVVPLSKGADSGVQPGWKMTLVNGEPFSQALLHRAVLGSTPYTISFTLEGMSNPTRDIV